MASPQVGRGAIPSSHVAARRLPENLARLYETFGVQEGQQFTLLSGDSFVVDGVEFVCDYQPDSRADRFFIVKPIEHVRQYMELFEELRGAAIFELGIAEGGSTALTALLASPRKLVAIDNETERLTALDEFIAARGLGEVVRPYWGVDQGDRGRLMEIVEVELAGDAIDLVVDDASHQLDLTRTSFETLFPYLRPGGRYVIEDWTSDHVFYDAVGDALRDPTQPGHEEHMAAIREALRRRADGGAEQPRRWPLSQIGIELILARASSGEAVAKVSFGRYSIVVERGPGELDPRTFRLREQYHDHFGLDALARSES